MCALGWRGRAAPFGRFPRLTRLHTQKTDSIDRRRRHTGVIEPIPLRFSSPWRRISRTFQLVVFPDADPAIRGVRGAKVKIRHLTQRAARADTVSFHVSLRLTEGAVAQVSPSPAPVFWQCRRSGEYRRGALTDPTGVFLVTSVPTATASLTPQRGGEEIRRRGGSSKNNISSFRAVNAVTRNQRGRSAGRRRQKGFSRAGWNSPGSPTPKEII